MKYVTYSPLIVMKSTATMLTFMFYKGIIMINIINSNTDPYFNLATERYLLKNSSEDIFMMWQNEPSVIIGKHQNVDAEVNIDFARENQIKIARRISGGGAVYHDLGNVNLTFIERHGKYDFTKYPVMIIDFLSTIGISATQDKRLGLEIDGLKISGSAQYIYKDTSLFHATLLFSSNLMMLRNVLLKSDISNGLKFVQSVHSPVTNISQHLKIPVSIGDFKKKIMRHFTSDSYTLDEKDLAVIEQLKTQQK